MTSSERTPSGINPDPDDRKRTQGAALGARDVAVWLGHSIVAGLIMFVGLWALVEDFPFERALRFGLATVGAAFLGGLLYFGVVYLVARGRAKQHARD